MTEKRMLIIDAGTVRKIDENRGDLSVSDFINLLIDNHIEEPVAAQQSQLVTKEEFQHFEEGIRDLMRSFLEFFLSYGLELGNHATEGELDKLGLKLKGLTRTIKTKKQ